MLSKRVWCFLFFPIFNGRTHFFSLIRIPINRYGVCIKLTVHINIAF